MQTLKNLDNQTILKNVNQLISCERSCTAKLIAHLAEIDRRSLYLELGFKSLFEYCQKELMLDESQCWLRIQVARKCQAFPKLLEELMHGRISMTVCGRIAPHLTPENCMTMILETAGMTRSQVEEYLVKIKPRDVKKTSLRKAVSSKAVESTVLFQPRESGTKETVMKPVEKRAHIEAANEDRYNLSLSITKDMKEKLDRLAEVLGKDSVKACAEELLDFALEAALDKRDPRRKAERVEKRQRMKKETDAQRVQNPLGMTKQRDAQQLSNTLCMTKGKRELRSRYIPASTTRQVLKRAGYRCQYHSSTGRRCSQTKHLQIDHIAAFGKGGDHSSENLQVLCRSHNLAKAKEEYGEAWIRSKITNRSLG